MVNEKNKRGPLKLVFLYGAPASGKLTVAEELSKIMGYKIFHNHLTFDVASSVFGHDTEAFSHYLEKLRMDILEVAAKEGDHHLIATFCYSHPEDGAFVKKLQKKLGKYGAEIFFVHVHADPSVLKERVKEVSRKKFNKIKQVKKLDAIIKKYDFMTPIPFVEGLSINNTNLSAKKVARMVEGYFDL